MNPIKALTSGEFTKDDIGKTVYLSNSVSPCQEWRIADVNHDDTVGTVDLWPKYFLENKGRLLTISDPYRAYYEKSSIRQWLNADLLNGFTDEVQNAMVISIFKAGLVELQDKVKCPSLTEIGANRTEYNIYDDFVNASGTIYPLFGSTQYYYANIDISYVDGKIGDTQTFYTRDPYTSGYDKGLCCTGALRHGATGICLASGSPKYLAVGFIRFGKK